MISISYRYYTACLAVVVHSPQSRWFGIQGTVCACP